jgi:hypothetical protein
MLIHGWMVYGGFREWLTAQEHATETGDISSNSEIEPSRVHPPRTASASEYQTLFRGGHRSAFGGCGDHIEM